MYVQDPTRARRPAAANAPDIRRFGRTTDWLLSIAFAGLLGAAVWKLDDDGALSPANPPQAVGFGAWTRALIVDVTDAVIRSRPDASPPGPQQSAPEGWTLWNGDRFGPGVPARCLRTLPTETASVHPCDPT